MMLVSVSGSSDDLAPLSGVNLLGPRATNDGDDQWTVVAFADENALAQLNAMNFAVTVIQDQATVDAAFDTALSEIEPGQ